METIKIETVGFESSRIIGQLEIHENKLIKTINGVETMLPLLLKGRNDYFYIDHIENNINSFSIVCHIVWGNDIERHVLWTLFLRSRDELKLLIGFIKDINERKCEPKSDFIEANSTYLYNKQTKGKGFLSKRRFRDRS